MIVTMIEDIVIVIEIAALNEIQVTKPDGTTEDFVRKFPRYS